ARDGYIVHDGTNCKYSCEFGSEYKYCGPLCEKKKAKTGYCYLFACWCIEVPDEVRVWGEDGFMCWS
uniref:Neurotoxin-like protein STR1 n=1 Tax=Androctonus australis TaxID=6858 RepID=SCXL_ANDAU|nr:RecName: Full=Neurotoxin-like protein STR1; AltName: Full=Anatoxin AaH STR1; Short=AaHSTR1 [Androctonus australis]